MHRVLQPGVRFARPNDLPTFDSLVRQLAGYERLVDSVTSSEHDLQAALFGEPPFVEGLVAEISNALAGFALYFTSYSTFRLRRGLYIEDLFVVPEHRGKGLGTALLTRVIGIASERNYGRVEPSVLNRNEPAIRMYKRLGPGPMDDWTVYRVSLR